MTNHHRNSSTGRFERRAAAQEEMRKRSADMQARSVRPWPREYDEEDEDEPGGLATILFCVFAMLALGALAGMTLLHSLGYF